MRKRTTLAVSLVLVWLMAIPGIAQDLDRPPFGLNRYTGYATCRRGDFGLVPRFPMPATIDEREVHVRLLEGGAKSRQTGPDSRRRRHSGAHRLFMRRSVPLVA
jgi:hypothetical protein